MLLAFDDTDSPDGGCTTHALLQVLHALPGVAPAGLPRLVRLNPNVPWKTRGNGAVCVPLARMEGASVRIGEWRGMEIHAHPNGPPATLQDVDVDAIWSAIQSTAQPGAQPAMLVCPEPPAEAWYWSAVRTTVDPSDAVAAVDASDMAARWTGDGRALIGCLGAAAWRGPATSHEFLAYREPDRWGTPRDVSDAPLRGLDASGATFHTEDPASGRLACVPNTPCPVLLGLRGTDPDQLLGAATRATLVAAREPVDAWLLWDSNQASGDHVSEVPSLLDAEPGMTVRLDATVAKVPESRTGGHVHAPMTDAAGGAFTAVAFEPTGPFREPVRDLRPGDEVTVTGGWDGATVRLESMQVCDAVPEKLANPECCGRPMKSRGAGAGYKCGCGKTAHESAARFRERPTGTYQVPVMARRHLHRPW